MSHSFEAVYDGSVLRPDGDPGLEPNTRVKVTIELVPPPEKSESFLDVAESLDLTGPSDWSRNIDRYLYGDQEPRA